MIFTSSQAGDIQRYYQHCYVKFRETGDVLYYITRVDPFKISGKSENGDLLELFLDDAHPYHMEYILPKKSYFQFGGDAAQLFRIPAKQYYRGLNESNTQIHSLNPIDGSPTAVPVNFETLKAYVNKPKFFTLDEAVMSKNASCALSPRMAFHRPSGRIFVDFVVVGHYDAKQRRISVGRPLFRPELEKLVQQNASIFNEPISIVEKAVVKEPKKKVQFDEML